MKDRLVTLIGGGGFLGRYVARELLAAGARVRIAQRDPRKAWFLKTQGGLGQTQFVSVDIRKPESLARALSGSDAVVNLVGVLTGQFHAFHVAGAGNAAKAAAEAGATSFVQVSAIGADSSSASAYGRTKGQGEAAVRTAFPSATILRPSIVFGREDQFVNRFAKLIMAAPVLPVLRAAAKFQPVYVGDVASAVVAAIAGPGHAGRTYELGGPDIITMGALNRWIAKEIGRKPAIIELPDAAGAAMARTIGALPGAPITWDQWLMLQQDNVVANGADGLAALGIAPTPLASIAPGYLVQYRRQGRFAKAVAP